jgi:hypothetical protein
LALERLLGEADAGDLGLAVGAARDDGVVHRDGLVLLLALGERDALDAEDRLLAGDVREPGRADDIADRVDPADARLVGERLRLHRAVGAEGHVVGLDVVLDDLDAERVVEEPVEAALDADREEHLVGLEVFFLLSSGFPSFIGAMVP